MTISVVIETLNLEAGPETGLPEVVRRLRRQTCPVHEIIVVVDVRNPDLLELVRHRFPEVRLLETRDSTYFSMKDEGARVATSEIVALLDSDCAPCLDWARSIVSEVKDGADVVAGRTRYDASQPLSTLFNFFNFGYVKSGNDGQANSFLPNNVAFRREVYLKNPFDLRIRRSGAAHLLCQNLKARGYRIRYQPSMTAIHNSYGVGDELLMRVKAGYDMVNLSLLDSDSVMKETRYLKAGPLALPRIFMGRLVFDFRLAIESRGEFGLNAVKLPCILLASLLIRGVELISALVTLVNPSYFREKFGW